MQALEQTVSTALIHELSFLFLTPLALDVLKKCFCGADVSVSISAGQPAVQGSSLFCRNLRKDKLVYWCHAGAL